MRASGLLEVARSMAWDSVNGSCASADNGAAMPAPRTRTKRRRIISLPMDAVTEQKVTPDDYPALVRAAADGDEKAMERLLLRAQESAYRFSVMVCGRTNETEDVM